MFCPVGLMKHSDGGDGEDGDGVADDGDDDGDDGGDDDTGCTVEGSIYCSDAHMSLNTPQATRCILMMIMMMVIMMMIDGD